MSDLYDLTERVQDMLEVVRDTPPGERRRKLVVSLLKRGSDLDLASKAFAAKLEKQSDWLLDNPHHPDHDKREAALLRNIKRYEEVFDVNALVLSADGGDA